VVWGVERRGRVVEGHAGEVEVRLLVSVVRARARAGLDLMRVGKATRRDLARRIHLSLFLWWTQRGWRGRERRCRIMPR
jgi:hypothetical protein